MSATEEVTVEPAAEEKTETKEVKGTKRAAEVSIWNYYRRKKKMREKRVWWSKQANKLKKHKAAREKKKILISDSIIDTHWRCSAIFRSFPSFGAFINHRFLSSPHIRPQREEKSWKKELGM